MLESLPEETTQLLIDVCTSLAPLTVETDVQPNQNIRQGSAGGPSYLSYLALNRPVATSPSGPPEIITPLPTQPSVSRQTSVTHDDPRSGAATPSPMTPSSSHLPPVRRSRLPRVTYGSRTPDGAGSWTNFLMPCDAVSIAEIDSCASSEFFGIKLWTTSLFIIFLCGAQQGF